MLKMNFCQVIVQLYVIFYVVHCTVSVVECTMSVTIEKITPPHKLSEGPHWDVKGQKLYYVDIVGQKIHRFDPATGNVTYAHVKKGQIGFAIPVEGEKDKFIAGCGLDVVLVTWDGESNSDNPPVKTLASFGTDQADLRINDGKCDAAGRLWTGTMSEKTVKPLEASPGALYSVDKDLNVKKQLSSISISNGLAWSLDNKVMYYIDSPTRQVWGFDYSDDNIKNKRVVFDLKKNNIHGVPDGMTIDTDGNLWIAVFNGNSVIQVDPRNGSLLRTVKLPVNKVTSVAFGGSNFDVLYVTTANILSEDDNIAHPDNGCLYSIKGLGVKGFPPNNFKCIS